MDSENYIMEPQFFTDDRTGEKLTMCIGANSKTNTLGLVMTGDWPLSDTAVTLCARLSAEDVWFLINALHEGLSQIGTENTDGQ